MSLVSGINHVAILTGDLDRFIRFYSDVFELELLFREATPAFAHAILRAGTGCWLHPAHVPDSAHGAAISEMFARGHLDHIALTAPSEQAFHTLRQRLVERRASTGAIENLGAFRALWFVDPDGMRGELALIVDPQLRDFHAPRPYP